MTQTREFSGKDVSAAIQNACTALNLSKDKLKYDVISEGASGIFGIVGRKDAKIRVSVPETIDPAAARKAAEGIKSIVDEAFGEETRKAPSQSAPKPVEPSPEVFEEKPDDPSDDLYENDDDTDTPYDLDGLEAEETEDPVFNGVDVTQEAIDLGVEALQNMANLITDDATVSAHAEQDRLTLRIEGGNAGILIGRKGQTLDAMQFLVDKMINRKSDARVRVKVDIEGYMETRKANLKHLAIKMADKAKKTGRPATINQMSAQDRRIVHLALKDDMAVRTQSMGDGYYRRLVIFPKKKAPFRGKKRSKR